MGRDRERRREKDDELVEEDEGARDRERRREKDDEVVEEDEGARDRENGDREDKKSKRKVERSSDSESESDSGGSESSESEEDRRHKRSKRKRSSSSKRRSRRRHSDEYSDSDSGSSSYESESECSDSEEERRRRKRRERKKREEREKEKERKRRRREKERKRRKRDEEDERRRKKKKKKDKEKKKDTGKKGAVTNSWGQFGIIKEIDMWNKRPEFTAWLSEVKQVNLESLPNYEEKKMFKEYMEDYNTATMPSKKYYNLDAYHKDKMEKQMRKGMKKLVKTTEMTVFNDEEQRRLELLQEREKQKQQEVESLKFAMQSGMAQAMKEQARLREEMQYLFKIGSHEAAAAIQRRLDPDVPM